jgi:3-deoxy-manno-octulosonate cytidylyltransferase (CMP-KDO synthetase)
LYLIRKSIKTIKIVAGNFYYFCHRIKINLKMKAIIVIPARYKSSRFPGKPLAMIGGKMMIQRVYERAMMTGSDVYIATDDERIEDAVKSFGGKVVMTSSFHNSGTERCAEVVAKLPENFSTVVNVQGDEPFIDPEQIKKVINLLKKDKQAHISTLVKKIRNSNEIFDPNIPKVVFDSKGYALYFSRSPIPYVRGSKEEEWFDKATFYKHIGIYGYRREVLLEITALDPTQAEQAESLEQLRWLQNGYKIKTAVTEAETISVDTPEDVEKAELFLKNNEANIN